MRGRHSTPLASTKARIKEGQFPGAGFCNSLWKSGCSSTLPCGVEHTDTTGSTANGQTPSGTSRSSLCEYCAEIDFEILRNPIIGDLQLLNAGGEPTNQYPFKREPPEVANIQRNLGLHSRIEASAASCVFCNAIVQVHKQQPHVLGFMRDAGVLDPLCIATIGPAGRLLVPEGVTWQGLKTEEIDYDFLRRLSLEFRPLEAGEGVQPGVLLNRGS